MPFQCSVGESVRVDGVNVYNGRRNYAKFHPAEEGSGITFYTKGRRVPVNLYGASHKKLGIGLEDGNSTVYLVEHMLSAVYALGIDNLDIELSDDTCPTSDNCAKEYFDALKAARSLQSGRKKHWKYAKADGVTISCDGKPDRLTAVPANGFVVDYLSSYPHKGIGEQRFSFRFSEDVYSGELAGARPPSFLLMNCLLKPFLLMGKAGLHGITGNNYLHFKKNGESANPEGLGARYGGDEIVRHKMIDALGALALTGRQFADTRLSFEMTGHKFDLYALKKLFNEGFFEDYNVQ